MPVREAACGGSGGGVLGVDCCSDWSSSLPLAVAEEAGTGRLGGLLVAGGVAGGGGVGATLDGADWVGVEGCFVSDDDDDVSGKGWTCACSFGCCC